MSLPLICRHDGNELLEKEGDFFCNTCERKYEVTDGVVRTLDKTDEFYEGSYKNQTHFVPRSEKFIHSWPLWLINSGYLWMVRKFVPEGANVVELGCAGGIRYFGERYRMIGCDLSFSSLRGIDFYDRCIQADAGECIGLPDNSVDAVISSYFWEHIPSDIKPNILGECRRILKPGGKLIFLYDVETNNPLISKYKMRNMALYKKLFIDGDGHLGYEYPEENIGAFEKNGFKVERHQGMEKTWLQSPSVYAKLVEFNNSRFLAFLNSLGRAPWFYPYTALVRIMDAIVCPFLPARWARIDMIVAERHVDVSKSG